MDMSVAADTNRTIEPKMHFTGKVIKTRLAGAVIDIGIGKPAVLHISQVVGPEGAQIKRIEDVIKEGDSIDVWVKKIARKDDEERIELTMVRPLDLEWREIKVGEAVKGKIIRLEKFGAFVEIGAERPGLVHISEMAHGYVKVPGDVVKEGDEIEAQIIEVNRRKKQIKLSMKALQPVPEVVEEKPKPTAKQNPARFSGEKSAEKKPARKPRRRPEEDNSAIMAAINETGEPEPTAMELAMKAAMEKAKEAKKKQESRKGKSNSQEQEDILSRTLETKQK